MSDHMGQSILTTVLSTGLLLTSLLLTSITPEAIVVIDTLITATSGSGTISPDQLTVTGLAQGDTVTVQIFVANPDLDPVQGIFSTMFIDDQSVVDLNPALSGAVPILSEPGFGGSSLTALASPAQKAG